jgi:transposase
MGWTAPERHRCARVMGSVTNTRKEPSAMQVSTIGLDLAKQVFQVHGVDAEGVVVLRRRLRRSEVVKFFSTLSGCLIGVEACATAHHWARELSRLGHQVKLIPPSYVKAYVKRGKTDAADAEAICEAVSRPSMRFVPLKSMVQQSALMLHRSRDLLVRQRTMLVNAVRGHFAEFGIVAPQGIRRVGELAALLIDEDATTLPSLARQALRALLAQLQALEKQIASLEAAVIASHRENEVSRRLVSIPGVGPITASAIVASVADAHQFKSARHFAAWLGLTPRSHSTGGKERLGGISKQGDPYLRRLLVTGATCVIRYARRKAPGEGGWVKALLARRPARLVSVALANKMARIVWALLVRGNVYQAPVVTVATI